ncbi:hypothetical protein HDU76_001938 [Blyttiomyces sp. JEL0837]|nr:hypothetical protein HDU76_001938 [Blyttiomyces sp. JEL0837]
MELLRRATASPFSSPKRSEPATAVTTTVSASAQQQLQQQSPHQMSTSPTSSTPPMMPPLPPGQSLSPPLSPSASPKPPYRPLFGGNKDNNNNSEENSTRQTSSSLSPVFPFLFLTSALGGGGGGSSNNNNNPASSQASSPSPSSSQRQRTSSATLDGFPEPPPTTLTNRSRSTTSKKDPISEQLTTPPQPTATMDLEAFRRRWTLTNLTIGAQLLFDGVLRTIRSPRSRRPLLTALTQLAIVTVVLLAIGKGATLPLRVFRHYIGWWIKGTFLGNFLDYVISVTDSVVFWFVLNTPDAGLFFVRYIHPYPLDRLFFESMKTLTSELALPGTRARFSLRFARSLESAPGGRMKYMAWPSATFIFLGLKIGWTAAIWICGIGIVSPPWGRYLEGPMLRTLMSFRAMERELVEPYLCRSKMTHDKKKSWFYYHEPVIAGFTLPCAIMLSIPFLGPALYFGIAQAAAARLCLEFFDDIDLFEGGPREYLVRPGVENGGADGSGNTMGGQEEDATAAGLANVFASWTRVLVVDDSLEWKALREVVAKMDLVLEAALRFIIPTGGGVAVNGNGGSESDDGKGSAVVVPGGFEERGHDAAAKKTE